MDILASFDSGDVPVSGSPTWLQYGFLFTTPADNAQIVLRLRNNAPGGQGNDLALDDIAFRPCGAKITVDIQNSAADTIEVCEGNMNTYTFLAMFTTSIARLSLAIEYGSRDHME